MTTQEIVIAYLRAVESQEPGEAERYMHPEIEVVEHPNRVTPRASAWTSPGCAPPASVAAR